MGVDRVIAFAARLMQRAGRCCHIVGWRAREIDLAPFSGGRNGGAPRIHRRRPKGPVRSCRGEMALDVEGILDGGMRGEKSLRRSGALEALHLAFSSPRRLMRILRPVVAPSTSFMASCEPESMGCDQDVENFAFAVDGPPQIDHEAIDLQIDFVEMPTVWGFGAVCAARPRPSAQNDWPSAGRSHRRR